MILLSYISLCFSEDIDKEKLFQSDEEITLSTPPHEPSIESFHQANQGTTTYASSVQPEMNEHGTTSFTTNDTPSPSTITTTGTSTNTSNSPTTDATEEIVQGTGSCATGSSTNQIIGTKSPTTGSSTTSSQPMTGTDTIALPQGIWGKIGSWMIAFSGMPTIIGSPSITGLILVPTAFRLDKQTRLNMDFIFTYYIGEFWNKTKEKIDIFNPINRLSCSGDFKYSFILEKKWIPAIAVGYQRFISLQGKASSVREMGGAVSEKSESFGYTYGILSKRLKNIGIHIGSQSGPIGKLINPLSNKLNITSNSALIAGLDTIICKRKTFVEVIYPQGNECMLINTFVDNFLPFNFTYIRFNNKSSNNPTNGYSLSGYFGIRTTGFPGTKKKEKKLGQ